MNNFIIDKENKRVIIVKDSVNLLSVEISEDNVINEFDKIYKTFLEGTKDIYECELILVDVDIKDENQETVRVETKAFARRIGRSEWLMEFNLDEYTY